MQTMPTMVDVLKPRFLAGDRRAVD